MGFLKSLFGGDPAKDLEKGERFLGSGQPHRALEIGRKLLAKGEGEWQARAEALVLSARRSLVENALTMAGESEESEYFEDAVDWLERASEQLADMGEEGRAQRLEVDARRQALVDRIEREEAEDMVMDVVDVYGLEDDGDGDGALPFEILVDTLRESAAARYLAQGEDFQHAFVAFNHGDTDDAIRMFDALLDRDNGNAVARLERGRCRLLMDDMAGARDDFEAAWESWGDEPLDRAGSLSVPGLWAEAQLALGEPEPIVERLEEAADPDHGRLEATLPYAQALVLTGDLERAEAFLGRAMARFPSNQDLSYLFAGVLVRGGHRDDARAGLEAAIAPSCATGNCARPRKHAPSLRLLVDLYLGKGDLDNGDVPESSAAPEPTGKDIERAGELMTHLADAVDQRLGAEDFDRIARYRRLLGDDRAAEEAEADAERLREMAAELGPMPEAPQHRPGANQGRRALVDL